MERKLPAVRRPEMITTPKLSADTLAAVPNGEATLEAVSRAPILITEHAVAFATAAAVPVPSPTIRRWTEAIHAVRTAASWMLRTSRADSRPARRDYPRRYAFLENALMSREMDRL
jgi:hypothetical protein